MRTPDTQEGRSFWKRTRTYRSGIIAGIGLVVAGVIGNRIHVDNAADIANYNNTQTFASQDDMNAFKSGIIFTEKDGENIINFTGTREETVFVNFRKLSEIEDPNMRLHIVKDLAPGEQARLDEIARDKQAYLSRPQGNFPLSRNQTDAVFVLTGVSAAVGSTIGFRVTNLQGRAFGQNIAVGVKHS